MVYGEKTGEGHMGGDQRTITSLMTRVSGEQGKNEVGFPNWEPFLYTDPDANPDLEKMKDTECLDYGVERRLYEINPTLPCLSPCLIQTGVLTPVEALIALEAVAGEPGRPSFPVDQHLAAFLMARGTVLDFTDLQDVRKPQREIKNLAALRILAAIQNHCKVNALPNLCQWMAEICAPMITHYHNLETRARIQEEIANAVSSGQLRELGRIFGNRQALVEDRENYQEAKIEVLLIASEIKEIEARILNFNRSPFTGGFGRVSWLGRFWSWISCAKSARKGKSRMKQLYHRSENLLDLWGDGLLPQGGMVKGKQLRLLTRLLNLK
jgi:hypothetical protein